MRAFVCVAVLIVGATATVVGQQRLCFRAKPKPDCGAFVLTHAGGYVMFGGSNGGGTALRGAG